MQVITKKILLFAPLVSSAAERNLRRGHRMTRWEITFHVNYALWLMVRVGDDGRPCTTRPEYVKDSMKAT